MKRTWTKKTIDAVRKAYPNCQVRRVAEAHFPYDGWTIIAWIAPYSLGEQVADCLTRGASSINFEIEDQNGIKRFPDYHKDELRKIFH